MVIGFASLVLAISLFLDWYTFNVPFIGSASRSGTWTSEYLYAAFALSVEAVVYLAARSVWSELQLKGRFVHHAILIGLTTGSLAVTLIAFVTKPALTLLGIPIPVDWAYGAYIAVPAAVVAMVASVGQLVGNLAGARSAPVTAEPEGRPADLATAVPETHEAQPSAAQTPSSCPRCGAPRGLDDRFCARCGASFEEGAMGQGGHRSAAA